MGGWGMELRGLGVTRRKDGLVTRPGNGGAAGMETRLCSGSKPTRQDRVLLLQRDLRAPSLPLPHFQHLQTASVAQPEGNGAGGGGFLLLFFFFFSR